MTRFRTLWHDRRAAALIEFAIMLPVVLMLFVGGYQLSDAITAQRKVTIMTRAVADLTSQYRTLRAAELDGLMEASTQILTPYATEPVSLRVTQITVDGKGEAFKIDWSRARNNFAFPKGDYPSWFIPAAYRRPNMVFIITESSYRYNSVLPNYFDTITFSNVLWLLPRRSATITLT